MKRDCSSGTGCVLMWTVAVQLLLFGSGVHTSNITKNCKLFPESERNVLERLETLTQRNFTVDVKTEKEDYSYVFQICGDVVDVPGAGIVQVERKKTGTQSTMIGTYNYTQIIGGSEWLMLSYKNPSKFERCTKPVSQAIVMITCNTKTVGSLRVLQENKERDSDCIYLFELESSAVCQTPQSRLGTGSILLIIAFCLLVVYLIGGFLYQRVVVGAKGLEQFPNYAFWVEVGNLTADGCDFVCRSRSREEASAYREVPADPLEEEADERDDHLLPM